MRKLPTLIFVTPPLVSLMTSEEQAQKSVSYWQIKHNYPDLGTASDWLKQIFNYTKPVVALQSVSCFLRLIWGAFAQKSISGVQPRSHGPLLLSCSRSDQGMSRKGVWGQGCFAVHTSKTW